MHNITHHLVLQSGVPPSSEVCVRCRCWTEWTENQIRTSLRNGCKCLIQERYVARPGGLEFPTFWLPRQTVPVKFTLIKSFRFKEWCARGGLELWFVAVRSILPNLARGVGNSLQISVVRDCFQVKFARSERSCRCYSRCRARPLDNVFSTIASEYAP